MCNATIPPVVSELALLIGGRDQALNVNTNTGVYEIGQALQRQILFLAVGLRAISQAGNVKQHVFPERPLKLVEERWRGFVQLVQTLRAGAKEHDVIIPLPEEPHAFVPEAGVDRAEFWPHERYVSLFDLFRR